MFWIIITLSLLVAAADWRFYRRHIARKACGIRIAFIAIAATDLLPIANVALYNLQPDNPSWLVSLSMWVIFVFIITVLPRLAFYFFQHFGLCKTGIAAAALCVAAAIWGVLHDRTDIRLSQIEITSPKLPVAFDGLRIVHFSDLHIGTLLNPEVEMSRLVAQINALKPDLVVFSGDLVNIRYTELDERAMRILSGIKAPLGIFSSIGNHDAGVYIKDTVALPESENNARLLDRQQAMGWRVLDNTSEYIIREGDTITISGVSFDPAFRKQRHDRTLAMDISQPYANIPSHLYNITISHLPQLWDEIRKQGHGDLTLAGHVHAMQLSVGMGCCRFSPARLFYKRWTGLYQEQDHHLYINDGIGYVGYPMRIGARPEITLITLQR